MPTRTAATPAAQRLSKVDQVVELLKADQGASLDEIVAITGWQPHSARAVLTGLKKRGYAVTREKINGVSRYGIVGADAS